jgi:carbon-monoxide dehydrogenase small subunit
MIQIRDISTIELDINGEKRKVTVRAADTLLHTLREQLGLTGAKAEGKSAITWQTNCSMPT